MNTYFKKKGEVGHGTVLVTEDGNFEFEVFATSELTYLHARHVDEATADEKTGKKTPCYFDRADGGRDEFVTFLPWEYVDTHSEAEVRDTVRNARRSVVRMSAALERTRVQRTYRVKITLDDGNETDARVTAYDRGQALSRVLRNEKVAELLESGAAVRKLEIEREESKKEEGCHMWQEHGHTYIRHLNFPRMTCEVTYDGDSDLKVMQMNPADERKATALDVATAMRIMGEYLVKHGKRSERDIEERQ